MSSYPFDLEKAIAAWRRPFEYNRAFSPEDLEELEGSLRDRVEALVETGMSEEAAFREALRRMGSFGTAETEYRKVCWGKLRRRRQLLNEGLWRFSMLKNYFKIALRTLLRQKGYAFLNIFGLAVGLACFILILLFVQHEFSYDRFHENADQIYRVVQRQPGNLYLSTDRFAVTPAALASALINEFPEVTEATTVIQREALLGFGDQSSWEHGFWADAHFFEVFSFPLLRGNPETALAEPGSIVLTESLARKIFGDADPMGQTLLYQNEDSYTVTGVLSDVPVNSSLHLPSSRAFLRRSSPMRASGAAVTPIPSFCCPKAPTRHNSRPSSPRWSRSTCMRIRRMEPRRTTSSISFNRSLRFTYARSRSTSTSPSRATSPMSISSWPCYGPGLCI